jgi:16S rRNA (uracil1498-N3)-methyltransferase
MTTYFYAPEDCFRGDSVVLPPDEARHATRVLRHREGDEIIVVDGIGGWFRVRLDHAVRDAAAGTIVERRRDEGEPSFSLTIALAPLKNPSRFETFLEKAVELGVGRVIPLLSERAERHRIKTARAENIIIAAMKQCGRSRLTELTEPMSFDQVISGAEDQVRMICHEGTDRNDDGIVSRLMTLRHVAGVSVLVGPEGGFTDEEVARAAEHGFTAVSLGPRRLRAETAAIAAAVAVTLSLDRTQQ